MSMVTALFLGMKMPVKYVAEMFCDRVAASRIYIIKTSTKIQIHWITILRGLGIILCIRKQMSFFTIF